jgi:hypothetical protein
MFAEAFFQKQQQQKKDNHGSLDFLGFIFSLEFFTPL